MLKALKKHSFKHLAQWSTSILTGLFLFITLYIYRAYDIDEVAAYSGDSLFTRAIIQGLNTSFVFYLFHFHIAGHLKVNNKWKLHLLNILATIVGLHTTFLWFNYFYNWTELNWISYFNFWYEYPLVVILPIGIGFLIGKVYQQNHIASVESIQFCSENGKQSISLQPKYFLFLKSADNYVEIYYKHDQSIKKELLRNTLKNISLQYSQSPYIKQCHRSYLVNPFNIEVQQQIGSKSIKLLVAQYELPVSAKYQKYFQL